MIKELFKNHKTTFITRKQLFDITDGFLNPKTMRNLDYLGKGIPGKVRVSYRTVIYPLENAIEWLEERFYQQNPTNKKTGVKNE